MKATRLVFASVVCVTLGMPRTGATQPVPGSVYVHGGAGFATQALGDWRDFVESTKQAFPEWTNVKTAFEPGAEVGYVVHPSVSIGLRVAHQRGTAHDAYGDLDLRQSLHLTMAMTTWTANAAFWLPQVPGLYVGLEAGRGHGQVDIEGHMHRISDPSQDWDRVGRWTGSGFVGGVFVGYQQRLGERGLWLYRAGWRTANLGTFDGALVDAQYGTFEGPPTINGTEFRTDFTGIGVSFGFGYSFGGRPAEHRDGDREARVR